jgi:alkylhydroperoxidase family enzyme
MARISLNPPQTLAYRIAGRFARRWYGAMPDPAAAVAHNRQVGRSYVLFEFQVQRWRSVNRGLKDLAVMAAATRIGCAWCMDFGYWEATVAHHVPVEKIHAIPAWRDAEIYDALERLVLEYAEAMTETPPSVTDELVARLSAHLSEAELVELTAIVAVENLRSRINSALGLTAQGFKDRCEMPAPGGAAADGAAAGPAAGP